MSIILISYFDESEFCVVPMSMVSKLTSLSELLSFSSKRTPHSGFLEAKNFSKFQQNLVSSLEEAWTSLVCSGLRVQANLWILKMGFISSILQAFCCCAHWEEVSAGLWVSISVFHWTWLPEQVIKIWSAKKCHEPLWRCMQSINFIQACFLTRANDSNKNVF